MQQIVSYGKGLEKTGQTEVVKLQSQAQLECFDTILNSVSIYLPVCLLS